MFRTGHSVDVIGGAVPINYPIYQAQKGAPAGAEHQSANASAAGKLVPRFRSSHHSAARSFANFGIEWH